MKCMLIIQITCCSYFVDLSCADQIMASPAWLPQEVRPSVSQAPVSGSPAGGPSTPSDTPLDSSVGTPSFSYSVPPNANITFGTSQQPSPSSVSTKLLK